MLLLLILLKYETGETNKPMEKRPEIPLIPELQVEFLLTY